MSDTSQGAGWWQASDGRWYPPDQHPDNRPTPPSPPREPAATGGMDYWLEGLSRNGKLNVLFVVQLVGLGAALIGLWFTVGGQGASFTFFGIIILAVGALVAWKARSATKRFLGD
jgi:hypothetical protein